MMAPQSKGDKLKALAKKVDKPKPEPVIVEEHFKIGATTTAIWGITVDGVLKYSEPAVIRMGKETEEDRKIRLRQLAIALNGKLGYTKCKVEYTPIEFTAVEDYETDV